MYMYIPVILHPVTDSLQYNGSSSDLANALQLATDIINDNVHNRPQCPDFCFLLLGGPDSVTAEDAAIVTSFRRACNRFVYINCFVFLPIFNMFLVSG